MPDARPLSLLNRALALAVAGSVLSACGGGGTDPRPVAVASVSVSPPTATLAVGATQQLTAVTRDANGNVLNGRAVTWSSSATAVATVSASGLVSAIGSGSATITATAEGVPGSATVSAQGLPVINSVTPAVLVPGQTMTITGSGFEPIAVDNTVTVAGVPAVVLSPSPTQLIVSVPCVVSGPVGVRVTSKVGASGLTNTTAQGTPRTIATGQMYVTPDASSALCTEIATGGATSRYLVAVFSNAPGQNTLVDFDLAGNPVPGSAEPALVRAPQPALPPASAPGVAEARFEAAHLAQRERDRAWYAATRARLPVRNLQARVAPARLAAVGDKRTFYFNFNSCNDSTQLIGARAIYVGSKAVIWEDTTNALPSTSSAALATYYQRIGQIFDAEQYGVVAANFGDPLLRDAVTDNDGHLHMVFTQRLNGTGAAAYVTGCDQFPRGPGFYGSNGGEFFYGFVPTQAALDVNSTAAPDGWFAFMGRTVVHEVKHIASVAARVANNAPVFEESWLEEGTARHSEELWVRAFLHHTTFKGNEGFGTAASGGVFCDFSLADATCLANDATHRPGWGVRRQLNEILPKMQQPWNWSPFGDATGQSGSVFYQTTWSLVRYTIDRYGASDAAFLTALTSATTSGTVNLSARAGVSFDQLLGGWGLALYADDYPGLAGASPDIQFATWNLRSIYAGLNAQAAWVGRFPTPYPLAPAPLAFGSFTQRTTGLRGGAHMLFEISGASGAAQLVALRSTAPGALASPFLRVAITRLQ
ncbi:MAG: Ig-like domain-containing protein [Gemmatimonadetes bacterium]|nr:Ig-like domain-containing protein [Gemmatimonadota bacterium]